MLLLLLSRLYFESELLGVRQDVQITNSGDGSLTINKSLGGALELLSSNAVNGLDGSGDLDRRASVDDARSSSEDGVAARLAGLQGVKLGLGNSLGQILLGNGALGDGLDSLGSLKGS